MRFWEEVEKMSDPILLPPCKPALRKILCSKLARPIPAKAFPYLLVAVTLLGLLLRLLELHLNGDMDRDSILYLEIAEKYITTGNYPGIMLPFLNLIMKYLYFLGIPPEAGGLAVNIAAGTALIPVVYLILRQFSSGREIPLAGAFLTAFHPTLTYLSSQILRDSPYLFFCGCSLLCCLKGMKKREMEGEKKSCLFWGLAGGFLALGSCCRYEILELFFLPFFYSIFAFITGRENKKHLFLKMGIFFTAFVAVLLLFLFINDLDRTFQELYTERFNRIWKENK